MMLSTAPIVVDDDITNGQRGGVGGGGGAGGCGGGSGGGAEGGAEGGAAGVVLSLQPMVVLVGTKALPIHSSQPVVPTGVEEVLCAYA